MEKQILLKNLFLDEKNIKNFICILDQFIGTVKNIYVDFSILEEDEHILKKMIKIESCELVSQTTKKRLLSNESYHNILISIEKQNLDKLIVFIKQYDMNVVVNCDSLKMFFNDNDGDFLVIDTKKVDYKRLKNLLGQL